MCRATFIVAVSGGVLRCYGPSLAWEVRILLEILLTYSHAGSIWGDEISSLLSTTGYDDLLDLFVCVPRIWVNLATLHA